MGTWVVALHGGAGAMRDMGAETEAAYRMGLVEASRRAGAVLEVGGGACAAAIAAVRHLEASGAFNAGAGSCLNRAGEVQVDAAVMVASTYSIGAVAAVPGVANAVDIAEAVRTRSPHTLLAGEGALDFARREGIALEAAAVSDAKLARYQALLEQVGGRERFETQDLTRLGGTHDGGDTVGAIVVDQDGEIALAVSTGGLWLKAPGRVGDTPQAGPGFWCEPGVGAAIATGTGEYITRGLLCARAVLAMDAGAAPAEAGEAAIARLGATFGEENAGLVLVNGAGEVGFAFDTQGMGRALLRSGWDAPRVAIYREEPA